MSDVVRVRASSRGHLVPTGDHDGLVHSVFTRSCNLAVDGLLVTVHGAETSHTPTSVRVAAPRWTTRARPGDPVTLREGELRFGAHLVDLHGAQEWSPADRRWAPTRATTGPGVRQLTDQRAAHCSADRHGSVPGLAAAVAGLARAVTTSQDAGQPGPDLTAAVTRLIGLGPGLTPSGDDVLIGVLAALHRCAAPPAARMAGALGAAVVPLLGRTTAISAHHLRLAVGGAFGEPLLDLTDALLGGAPGAALTCLTRRVLAIGASSGADAVLGLLTGLEVALGSLPRREPDPHPHEKVA